MLIRLFETNHYERVSLTCITYFFPDFSDCKTYGTKTDQLIEIRYPRVSHTEKYNSSSNRERRILRARKEMRKMSLSLTYGVGGNTGALEAKK